MRIMKFVSLEPMQSRGGNPLANQQILSDDNGSMFVSYGTKICYKTDKKFNIQGSFYIPCNNSGVTKYGFV